MSQYHGVNVNFGVGSSISTNTVLGLFQTLDHTRNEENELVKNGSGDNFAKNYFGFFETSTFEYVAYDNTGTPNGSGSVVIPNIGDKATVVDTQYPAIAGSTWLTDDINIKGSNTTSKRVTVKLSRYPFISN